MGFGADGRGAVGGVVEAKRCVGGAGARHYANETGLEMAMSCAIVDVAGDGAVLCGAVGADSADEEGKESEMIAEAAAAEAARRPLHWPTLWSMPPAERLRTHSCCWPREMASGMEPGPCSWRWARRRA